MSMLLYLGNSYARNERNKHVNRVYAAGGVIQNQNYIYDRFKLLYELGMPVNGVPLQIRRQYSSLAGVKLNGISNTNLQVRSSTLTVGWTQVNNVPLNTSYTDPLGGTRAVLFSDGVAVGARHGISGTTVPVTVSIGANTTLSAFVQWTSGIRYALLRVNDSGSNANAVSMMFDLQTGTISGATTAYGTFTVVNTQPILNYGNGWYRIGFSYTSSVASVSSKIEMSLDGTRTADGQSNGHTGADRTFGAFGVMQQAGSVMTDYIESGASTASATQNYVQDLYDFGNTTDSRVDATQASATSQPYYGTDSSLPSNVRGLVFDGSNDFMSVDDLGIFNEQAAGTLIAVAKDYNRTAGDTVHIVAFISRGDSAVSSRSALLTRNGGNIFAAIGRRTDADTIAESTATSIDGLNYLLGNYVWGGNTLQGVFNGSSASSVAFSSGGGTTTANNSLAFSIGAVNSTVARLNGLIASATAARIVLTTEQQAALRSLEQSYLPALP